MWRVIRGGDFAYNVIEETDDTVVVTKEYFLIRPTDYVVEKKNFADKPAAARIATFNTEEEAIAYLAKLVTRLNGINNHVDD